MKRINLKKKIIIWYVLGEWIKGRDFLQYKCFTLSGGWNDLVFFFLKNNSTLCCVFKLFLTGFGSK